MTDSGILKYMAVIGYLFRFKNQTIENFKLLHQENTGQPHVAVTPQGDVPGAVSGKCYTGRR